jgi:hypothetical protein
MTKEKYTSFDYIRGSVYKQDIFHYLYLSGKKCHVLARTLARYVRS